MPDTPDLIDRGRGGKDLHDRQYAALTADIVASLKRNRFVERSDTDATLLVEVMTGALRAYEAVTSMRTMFHELRADNEALRRELDEKRQAGES